MRQIQASIKLRSIGLDDPSGAFGVCNAFGATLRRRGEADTGGRPLNGRSAAPADDQAKVQHDVAVHGVATKQDAGPAYRTPCRQTRQAILPR
jgi:hypothetical protein